MPIGGSSGGLSSAGPGAGGGAQGPQGATGSQGPQGHQGFQGNQGTQGSGGAQGSQGNQGNTGAQGPAGAGSAGSPIVRKFPFAYNTSGILTGASLYTPSVGDLLMDAWIEIGTAWNGTSPLGDFGQYIGGEGLLQVVFGNVMSQLSLPTLAACLDMTNADAFQGNDPGLLRGDQLGSLRDVYTLYNVFNTFITGTTLAGGVGNPDFRLANYPTVPTTSVMDLGDRIPYKFTNTDPIKVCVSQDGTNTGANPGATQGAAVLYLVTATPV